MTIKVGEKEYALQWGIGALELYCDAMECDIDGLDLVFKSGRKQGRAIVTLISSAAQNGTELKGEEFNVSYREMQAWLDGRTTEEISAVFEDFKKSKYLGRTMEEYFAEAADMVSEEGKTKKKPL